MPIDYSKWKNIEVSDDEDDTHPNIDTPSLFRCVGYFDFTLPLKIIRLDNRFFRWRHQARLERMAEQKIEKEELEKKKGTTNSKIEVRLRNFSIC